jgi:bla regulator protein blaR1
MARQRVSKNLMQSTHQPIIRVENNITPALNSRVSLPDNNPISASKGLVVAQKPNEDDFNPEPYELTSNSVSMKTSSIDFNISVPIATKGSNRPQAVDRETVQEAPKKVAIAKQIHAQNNVTPERINSGKQPALIAQFDNQTPTSQISTLKTSASFNKEDHAPLKSEIFNKPLLDKITLHKQPYKQLSYNDEISELAAIDSQYHASTQLIGSTLPSLKINITSQPETDIAEVDIVDEAKLLNTVSPVYPNLAKRRGIEMEVKVNFIIDTNGRVKDLKFDNQSKLIYFKSAIRSAMRKWRFSPATRNNSNVESNMTKIFSFNLQS